MRLHIAASLASLFLSVSLLAQNYTVSGTITDKASGKPVDFATVVLESSEQWAVADVKGVYTIKNVPAGKNKLSVSCLGYVTVTREITVNGNISDLNVSLVLDNLRLESAVVTAKENSNSAATSRTIDKVALEHVQVMNLTDVSGLLPGGKTGIVWLVLMGVLFWLGEKTLVQEPRPETLDGLVNLYKPLFYLIPFLMGYFIFSHEKVQEMLGKFWAPLLACAVIAGAALVITTFGQDNTTPKYLGSPLNCLYGWLMCLAMTALFKARFDRTSAFAGYMTRSSFGIYVLHYLVIASLGYMMKLYTSLPPWSMYVILTVAVFTLTPLLYEIIRRIPVIRWCVLGYRPHAKCVR